MPIYLHTVHSSPSKKVTNTVSNKIGFVILMELDIYALLNLFLTLWTKDI